MRLSTLLIQVCALLKCATAKDAYLYTFNDEHQSPSTFPNTISANTGFAIASRRQGVADGLSLEGIDEQTLQQISEHGGYRQPLFSEATSSGLPRVLVRIYADKPDIHEATEGYPDFKIQRPAKDLLSVEPKSLSGDNHRQELLSTEGVRLVCDVFYKVESLASSVHSS